MTESSNHISTVREHLIHQLSALHNASVHTLEHELARAKGISELAQAATNTAKVEVDYLRATGQNNAPFFAAAPGLPAITAKAGQPDGARTALVGNMWPMV